MKGVRHVLQANILLSTDAKPQYLYPEFKAATLPFRVHDLGEGHMLVEGHCHTPRYHRGSLAYKCLVYEVTGL